MFKIFVPHTHTHTHCVPAYLVVGEVCSSNCNESPQLFAASFFSSKYNLNERSSRISSSLVTWEFGTSAPRAWPRQASGWSVGRFYILGAGSFVRELRGAHVHAHRLYLMLIPSPPFSLWRYLNFAACKLRHVNESQNFFVAQLHRPSHECHERYRVSFIL